MDPEEISRIERLLGHRFEDQELLAQALTHASVADSRLQSNERLEFLGDAVLGTVVCNYLYEQYEDLLEGELTKIKSTVVSRRTCAEIADELGLDEMLRLGKGLADRHALPKSVLAAVYESLIGALYIDGGLDAARNFILKGMERTIELAAGSGHQYNFKSVLQQTAQEALRAKCFEVCVEIGARRYPSCWGDSKQQAEQPAALETLLELGFARQGRDCEVRLCRPSRPSDQDSLEKAS
jgi:ribonuclease-3